MTESAEWAAVLVWIGCRREVVVHGSGLGRGVDASRCFLELDSCTGEGGARRKADCKLDFEIGPAPGVGGEEPGRRAMSCVNPTVRAVTSVAFATAAPARPAGYAHRSADRISGRRHDDDRS